MLQRGGAPGAGVALLVDGAPILDHSIGFRDIAQTQVLPEQSRFYVYSITKVMVAVAILQLVEQGELGLDSPVQSYLPDLPVTTPVSLRQLLNHSGGLPDYGSLPAYGDAILANPERPWSMAQFLAHTLRGELLYAPGNGWHYSNIGYLLLAMVLEQSYGRSLQEVLLQHIFTPLDFRHTYVARSLEGVEALSPGYTTFLNTSGVLEDMRIRYHPGWVAHGLVVSTAGELARFQQALFDGRLLSANLLEAMCQPHPVPGTHRHFRQPGYGLGLMLDRQSPHGLVAGHGGGGPGYSTAAFYFSDIAQQEVVSVALVNRDQADLGLKIAFALAEVIAAHS